jgi:hypothetical protein
VRLSNITALLPPITQVIRNQEETVRYIKERALVHKSYNLLYLGNARPNDLFAEEVSVLVDGDALVAEVNGRL